MLKRTKVSLVELSGPVYLRGREYYKSCLFTTKDKSVIVSVGDSVRTDSNFFLEITGFFQNYGEIYASGHWFYHLNETLIGRSAIKNDKIEIFRSLHSEKAVDVETFLEKVIIFPSDHIESGVVCDYFYDHTRDSFSDFDPDVLLFCDKKSCGCKVFGTRNMNDVVQPKAGDFVLAGHPFSYEHNCRPSSTKPEKDWVKGNHDK